jgi:hypothetical protein
VGLRRNRHAGRRTDRDRNRLDQGEDHRNDYHHHDDYDDYDNYDNYDNYDSSTASAATAASEVRSELFRLRTALSTGC